MSCNLLHNLNPTVDSVRRLPVFVCCPTRHPTSTNLTSPPATPSRPPLATRNQGSLPTEFGNLVKMASGFRASSNHLTGPIPTQFGQMTGLVNFFNFKQNAISGKSVNKTNKYRCANLTLYQLAPTRHPHPPIRHPPTANREPPNVDR